MRILGVGGAIAGAVALTACGGGAPATQAVHGQVLGGTQAAATVYYPVPNARPRGSIPRSSRKRRTYSYLPCSVVPRRGGLP